MHRIFMIHSRDHLIDFAQRVGEVLRALKDVKNKPVIMSANGESKSGKSLFALGIASVYDPVLKFGGIPKDMSADHALEFSPLESRSVIFKNFGRVVALSGPSFDWKLRDFEKENPGAEILIASNIERVVSGAFNYAAKGLQSEILDLHAEFTVLPGAFSRRIELTARDANVISAIVSLATP